MSYKEYTLNELSCTRYGRYLVINGDDGFERVYDAYGLPYIMISEENNNYVLSLLDENGDVYRKFYANKIVVTFR